jgi:hypothetical protein
MELFIIKVYQHPASAIDPAEVPPLVRITLSVDALQELTTSSGPIL